MHVWHAHTLLPRHVCRGQRMIFRNQFSPSSLTVLWYLLQASWSMSFPVSSPVSASCEKAGIADVRQ